MTDAAAFPDLVREAFIDPIRSVLIIDDQYPTWEEILNEQRPEGQRDAVLHARSQGKKWRVNPDLPSKLVDQFRKQKPALIIDIHDASNGTSVSDEIQGVGTPPVEAVVGEISDHLHQSDLLILDYNLEGSNTGLEGKLARKILSSVLQNQHFNLVVVHTEENLNQTFEDCLLSLHESYAERFDEKIKGALVSIEAKLVDLADEEKFKTDELKEHFAIKEYLWFRHPQNTLPIALRMFMKGEGPLASLQEWGKRLGLVGGDLKTFAFWAVKKFEDGKKGIFAETSCGGLNWSLGEDRLWLRTGRGFVTFVKKAQQDLLDELQQSLTAWQPTPSRLLSAKLRHEIGRNGVEAEDSTLSKKHVFAHFYKQICEGTSEAERAILLRDHLSRQTETLASQIENSIVSFGETIYAIDQKVGSVFSAHYGIDLSKDSERKAAINQFNSYVSTLSLKSGLGHLDCGHVFKLSSAWWVCATPTCDMQPGQNSIAFVGTSKTLRPFTALQLHKIDHTKLTREHINSGLYCFVEAKAGKVICLGLQPINGSGQENLDKVTWRTFMATQDGQFKDNQLDIVVPKLGDTELTLKNEKAEIVAKLRYEYALNFVQKVGASVTRIGLSYTS